MLDTGLMRSLLALALVAATPVVASAGTYLGLGVGTNASGHIGSDGTSMAVDGNRSGRLILGLQFGRLSIEGNGVRFSQPYKNRGSETTSLAAALKYSLPLGDRFEAFGRAGVQRSSLSTATGEYGGNGWLLGAGFEYRLNLALTGASIFVDYTHNATKYDVADQKAVMDAAASMWTLGVTLSI